MSHTTVALPPSLLLIWLQCWNDGTPKRARREEGAQGSVEARPTCVAIAARSLPFSLSVFDLFFILLENFLADDILL